MPGEELLRIATRGGARAVGMGDELGCLEPGRRADLIMVDTSDLDHMGSMDPLFLAAHCVVGRDVRDVIVEGAVVMHERKLLGIDIETLRARVNERRAKIMERFDAMVRS